MPVQSALRHCHFCGMLMTTDHTSSRETCTGCNAELDLRVFPALTHVPVGSVAEAVLAADEATCFYHIDKRAAVACDCCGRFLCTLCQLEWGQQTLCPQCLSRAPKATTLLVRERTLLDSIALTIAGWSFALLYFAFFTAPVAIVLGIMALRRPGSLVRRRKWRAWLAITIATLQLIALIWLIAFVFLRNST